MNKEELKAEEDEEAKTDVQKNEMEAKELKEEVVETEQEDEAEIEE